ncbi:hypothetical protein B9Z19DRAFT_1090402 [Tuber borchii]|uniref:REJ domain-containing protein n=1 Tax=Tuber borchii TaxID=42251 RepID=A0A2T6ZIX7_TUBBO|nr:hypothetical protein B9Z19DRAFT_1090402 [Tuber borchii]
MHSNHLFLMSMTSLLPSSSPLPPPSSLSRYDTIYTKLTSFAVTHFTSRFLLPNSEILTSPTTSYAQLTNSVPGSSSPTFRLLTKNLPVATTTIHIAPSKYRTRTTLFNPHQSTSSKHPSFKHHHNRLPLSRYRSSSTTDLFSLPVRKPNGGYTMLGVFFFR